MGVLARQAKKTGSTERLTERSPNQNQTHILPPTPFPAPPGVGDEIWKDWVKHKGRKLTAVGYKQQVKFLAKQADPGACIEASIRNGWAGLFGPDRNGKAAPPPKYNPDGSLRVVL